MSPQDVGPEGRFLLEAPQDEVLAIAVQVTGTVQGVGFRPFVYRLATAHGLGGSVRNEGTCVRIELEGAARDLGAFLAGLRREAPPASRIEDVEASLIARTGRTSFTIAPSEGAGDRPTLGIPADYAICPECVEDLRNPDSRYYRYPFTSCTQCGPRYTITRRLPFDRERTAMDRFPLCPPCGEDYRSPASRRFHAQATACGRCGPRLVWRDGQGAAICEGEEALGAAKELLRAGGIVAVMGVGGFHLAVDARNEPAVARLRERKERPGKPLAVMMDEPEVAVCCLASEEELLALRSPAHPIVLLRVRGPFGVAPSVAPGMARLGVMLPYTALHHLLLEDPGLARLVMTSGNHSSEPLSYTVESALAELGDVADGFLCHTREIVRPVDDSVLRTAGEGLILLRRARGYVPESIPLPGAAEGLQALAVGADIKNAFGLLSGGRIWLSPHIGDLDVPKTLALFRQEVAWYCQELGIRPEVVVHDLHPGYRGTAFAKEQPLPRLAVQHHHAHIAACLLEHQVDGPVVGLALDGVGYGDDGGIWGGEALLCDRRDYRRIGHLRPLRLIGGDVATKEPWRIAFGYLEDLGCSTEDVAWAAERMRVPSRAQDLLVRVLRSSFPGFRSTSCGRLFDAAGALALGRGTASFEGELPMLLEAQVDPDLQGAYDFAVEDGGVLDWRPALQALIRDLRSGAGTPVVATRLHRGLAQGLAALTRDLAARHQVAKVALGGGVWQNEWLLRWFLAGMAGSGLDVLVPHMVPVGDGGLAVGQLAVLAARRGSGG